MPRTFLTAIDLAKNELQNAVVQNLATAPTTPGPGQLYYDSAANTLYWWDGTQWQAAKATATVPLGDTASNTTPGVPAAGGAATDASRTDHIHGLPDFGAATADTAFGSAVANGTATTFARSDHIHGNPVHDAAAHNGLGLATEAQVDDFTINTVPTSSLTAAKTGTTAGGDLTWTITLDSLTLANTIPGTAPDPNTPLVAGEPGDVYIDTVLGTAWINDGTGWVQLDPAVASGVVAVNEGNGINVDNTTPSAPVVSTQLDPTTNAALTVGAAGLKLDPALSTAPSGAAGGVLTGTYPDPGLAADVVLEANIAANAVNTTEILDAAVTDAKLAQIQSGYVKGRATAGAGVVENLTGTQVTTLLDVFSATLKGVTPASTGVATDVLHADGTWGPAPATGGPPTGAAGGDLTGNYPDPTIAALAVGEPEIADLAIFPRHLNDGTVANAHLVSTPAKTVKGNSTIAPAQPQDLTQVQLTSLILPFDTALSGAVPPAAGGGTVNFLRADGTWAAPAGGVAPARLISTTAPLTGGGDLSADRTLAITNFSGTTAGAVPPSSGVPTDFLRADGTWGAPAGGLDQATADTLYVNVAGDTMTGPLVLPLDPALPLEAATKQYVDNITTGVVRKFAADVGATATVPIAHNLNTSDVIVQVYRVAAPNDQVECDVQHTDVNTVTLLFATAPAAGAYRCVVTG